MKNYKAGVVLGFFLTFTINGLYHFLQSIASGDYLPVIANIVILLALVLFFVAFDIDLEVI